MQVTDGNNLLLFKNVSNGSNVSDVCVERNESNVSDESDVIDESNESNDKRNLKY